MLPALRDPAVMANRRLWHTIVEAMRAAKIREPERSATREILGETPPVGVAEKMAEGAHMTYELAHHRGGRARRRTRRRRYRDTGIHDRTRTKTDTID